MTLILTVANPGGIFQTSDFQLTDLATGKPLTSPIGTKQLSATYHAFRIDLAFTGVAKLGALSTMEWLSEELAQPPNDPTVEGCIEALAAAVRTKLSPLAPRALLTLAVAVQEVDRPPLLVIISNADWSASPPKSAKKVKITRYVISKPFVHIAGMRSVVSKHQRYRLKALAREINKAPMEILAALQDINAESAKLSGGYVSPDSSATAQYLDGTERRTVTMNNGDRPGFLPTLFGGQDMSEFIKASFDPETIWRVKHSASLIHGPSTVRPALVVGNTPRHIALTTDKSLFVMKCGAGHTVGSVSFGPGRASVEALRNAWYTAPFLEVSFSHTGCSCEDALAPRYPWPMLTLAGALGAVSLPRGLELSCGYSHSTSGYTLSFPVTSRSIRRVDFLTGDDELILVVPAATVDLAGRHGITSTGAIDIRLMWRERTDGTIGQ